MSYTMDISNVPVSYTMDISNVLVSYTMDISNVLVSYTMDISNVLVSYTMDISNVLVSYTGWLLKRRLAFIYFLNIAEHFRKNIYYILLFQIIILNYSTKLMNIAFSPFNKWIFHSGPLMGKYCRWKEKYFILTPDYLHCFKKGGSKISEMGAFDYKVFIHSSIHRFIY